MIALHFIGWSPEGDQLYTSYAKGKPVILSLFTALPSWREAIERMVIGEKRRVWVPPEMVAVGRGPQGATVFDLELLGLKSLPSPPRDLVNPPDNAVKTPSGAYTVQVEAGTGTEHPGPDSIVLVHYLGWTIDGKEFDSSYNRGRATAFPLNQTMPAFAEAVQMMVAGEKRQVWIPGPVAAGRWVGAPKGQLVFEIEMVRLLPDDALEKARPAGQAPPRPPSGGR